MTRTEQTMLERVRPSERVLFLAYNPLDQETAKEIFEQAGIELRGLEDLTDLCGELDEGAGCVLIAEERLEHPDVDRFIERLEEQPSWSDLPVLVITRRGHVGTVTNRLSAVANATLIERPVRINSLLSTVRAALGDRRRQYQLRRAIKNRDQFLAMLGHELRNPLAAIVLAIDQLLLEDSKSPALDIIERQCANLERIVDDLLEVSRISRGVISFEKERIDLIEVARTTAEAYKGIAEENDLELTTSLPDEPVWVVGDAVRLEQVISNLLSNAVRYTPGGGRIDVLFEHTDQDARVKVRDTGVGIQQDEIESIFDLFARADNRDATRDEGGMGLGLSLAHSIVRQHDGELTAYSEGEGKGSEFTLRLPIAEATRAREDALDSAPGVEPSPRPGAQR